MNARQVLQCLRGAVGSASFTNPLKRDQDAPEDINVFTDGNVIHVNVPCGNLEEFVFGGPKEH